MANCSEYPPPPLPPFPNATDGRSYNGPLEVGAGSLYVLAVWITAAVLIRTVVTVSEDERLSRGLVWAASLFLVFEGLSFSMNTLVEYSKFTGQCTTPEDCFRISGLWLLSQNLAGGFSWVSTFYLLLTKMKPRFMWMAGISLGLTMGFLAASLMFAGCAPGMKAAGFVFLTNFEGMNIVQLVAAIRLFCNGKIQKSASRQFLGAFLLVFGVHCFQLSFTILGLMPRYEYSMVVKNLLNSVVVPILGLSYLPVAREQALHDNIREVTAGDRDETVDEIKGVFVFPEYYWGLTLPVLALGYALSFLCLMTVANPPFDWTTNKIYAMYKTYHPCILLDFLPGTLMAQPLFTVSCLLYQAAALSGFVRTLCYGHLGAILLSAFTTVGILVFTTFFPLVFTFNPDKVSVLTHSIPFIFNQSAVAFFILSTMATILSVRDKILDSHRGFFGFYACFFATAELGGMGFMIVRLLANYGYGANLGTGFAVCVDPTCVPDNTDIQFQYLPFGMAVGQIFVQWSYAILNPLKFRPLAFDIKTFTGNVPVVAGNQEPDSQERVGRRFFIRLAGRTFLTVFAVTSLLTSMIALGLNIAVSGPEAESWGFRDNLRRLPGSAVGAVGWTASAAMLMAHVIVVCTYEQMQNPSQLGKLGMQITGGALVVGSLLAHASTIPSVQEEYRWFLGTEVFQVTLMLWIGVNIKRTWDPCSPEPTFSDRAVDTVAGVAAILGTLASIGTGIQTDGILWVDALAVVLVGVFSLTDARKISIQIANIHIATNFEVPKAFDRDFTGVPFFDVDLHGIKNNFDFKESMPLTGEIET